MSGVEVGTRIPEFRVESVDPWRMKVFAALARDPNPIHWDRREVAARGLGDRLINQGPTNLGYVCNMLVAWAGPEALRDLRADVRVEVPVGVEGDADRRVPHLRLEQLRVGAGGDHQRGVRVAEVVEADPGQPAASNCRPVDPLHEVVVPAHAAVRRRPHESELVRARVRDLLAEEALCARAEVDASTPGSRLRAALLAVDDLAGDDEGATGSVEARRAEREDLALPQAREGGNEHHPVVRPGRAGGQMLHLLPGQEVAFPRLAPRLPDGQDALVEAVAAQLRVA